MENTIKEILNKYPKSLVVLNKNNKEILVGTSAMQGFNTLVLAMLESPKLAGLVCAATETFYREHPNLRDAAKMVADGVK
mgnify:CR=1 FL=1